MIVAVRVVMKKCVAASRETVKYVRCRNLWSDGTVVIVVSFVSRTGVIKMMNAGCVKPVFDMIIGWDKCGREKASRIRSVRCSGDWHAFATS